jgi:paraquat-inducible protein B
LKKDSQFWIVSPRISHKGIYGLNTLFSGSYIELVPGSSKVKSYKYMGLEEPPATPAGTPGLHITLNSADQFAYSVGDPVVYKGLTVGQFEDVHFNLEEQVVYYNVFIRSPYHELITTNTRFWDVGGMRVDLTAEGISVETGNLQSLLTESVTFGLPEGRPKGNVISDRSYFDIYPDQETAASSDYRFSIEYVMLVGSSVRGLNVGAPVEYRGIPIGEVKAINYPQPEQYNLINDDYKIPVLIAIEPGRLGMPDSEEGVELVFAQNELWIQQGLRASLETGSLLTGQMFVELQHYADATASTSETFMGYPVIPLTLDDFSQITHQAGNLLDKLNNLPLESMVDNADDLLIEMKGMATSLATVGKNLQTVLSDVDQQELIKQLNSMLESMTKLASGYSEGSKGYEDITDTLETLNSRLQELQPLLLQLNQQPNSLIFSGDVPDDTQPKASRQSRGE